MKHPQFILAFDKNRFGILPQHLNPMSMSEFVVRAARSLVISRREELEKDERYGQLLPYILLWQRNPADGSVAVFAYQRGKGIGENRLLGNHSVGVGGHVDIVDVIHNDSVIDLNWTLAKSIRRELNEEIMFTDVNGVKHNYDNVMVVKATLPKFFGMINDESNEVGRVHHGVLFTHEIPLGYTPFCRESELETVGLIEPSHLEGATFENWSEIILDQFDIIEKAL